MKEKIKNSKQRYIGWFGAIAFFFVQGSGYSIPNYGPYLILYSHHLNNEPVNHYYSIMLTLQMIFYMLGQILSLYINRIFEGKSLNCLIIESALFVSGIFLCSVFSSVAGILALQIFSYGLMEGILAYTMLTYIWKLYPEMQSRITGIASFSVAFAPPCFNYITHYTVNP